MGRGEDNLARSDDGPISREAAKNERERLRQVRQLDNFLRSVDGELPDEVVERTEEMIDEMRADGHHAAVRHFSEYLEKLLAERESSLEVEIRLIRPDDFRVPDVLAGMRRLSTAEGWQRDCYFDTDPDSLGGKLKEAGRTLRIRELADGSFVATLKKKQGTSKKGKAKREEIEAPLERRQLEESNAAVAAAREITGKDLAELFTLDNRRTDHYFAGPESALVLSEDEITYPDGSTERRVELEHVHGVNRLRQAHEDLAADTPGLELAPRGKFKESRRRLKDA